VVLVGGNDVLALVSEKAKRFYRVFKGIPRDPSAEWYRENMLAIARALKPGTSTKIGFCSLTPIGENLDAQEPLQRALNRHLAEHSEIVHDVAEREGLEYLPVFERLCNEIRASPGLALSSFRFLPMYRDAFRALVLRQAPDEIANKNGWRIHTDGVHLNSRGGKVLAGFVQVFIEQ
jgi:hypothetical protein